MYVQRNPEREATGSDMLDRELLGLLNSSFGSFRSLSWASKFRVRRLASQISKELIRSSFAESNIFLPAPRQTQNKHYCIIITKIFRKHCGGARIMKRKRDYCRLLMVSGIHWQLQGMDEEAERGIRDRPQFKEWRVLVLNVGFLELF